MNEAFHITFCEFIRFETYLSNTENCLVNLLSPMLLGNADFEYYYLG